jgi:effector-binding domain-containing protein
MSYQLKMSQLDDQSAMTLRTRTPMSELPAVIGEGYGKIAAYIAEAAPPADGNQGYPYVVYHNMDMNDLDVEMGIPVEDELPGSGEVQPGVLRGGPAATCLYTGPYSGLGEAYGALEQWVEREKLNPTGKVYEIYYNDPAVTPPEELQTLIVFPLKQS